jgi:glycosyltransferase involved in cell wall biosynthesis
VNVTICIITRNRRGELAECLKSVAASSVGPAEIVVSDDSADQLTWELVSPRFPHVKYVDGPRPRLDPNRNSAIATARESGGPQGAIQLNWNAWHLTGAWRKEDANQPPIQWLPESNTPGETEGKSL